MSKTDIIMLAWLSPFVLVALLLPPALGVLLLQRIIPFLWRHYPRWWRHLVRPDEGA